MRNLPVNWRAVLSPTTQLRLRVDIKSLKLKIHRAALAHNHCESRALLRVAASHPCAFILLTMAFFRIVVLESSLRVSIRRLRLTRAVQMWTHQHGWGWHCGRAR